MADHGQQAVSTPRKLWYVLTHPIHNRLLFLIPPSLSGNGSHDEWSTYTRCREHPNPESTQMYQFMQALNRKHNLQLKVLSIYSRKITCLCHHR